MNWFIYSSREFVRLCAKERAPIVYIFLRIALLFVQLLDEGAELQFFVNFTQCFAIRFLQTEFFLVQLDGHIRFDGDEEFGKPDLFGVLLHFLAHCPFQFLRAVEQFIDAAKFGDEFHRRFLPHAGTTGNVVRRVAHQSEQVDDLSRRCHAIFFVHLLFTHHLGRFAARAGAYHLDVWGHELCIVLVGSHHPHLQSLLRPFPGQGADHVVRLVARHFQDGDAESPDDVLDDGHRQPDVLRRGFALRLVLRICLMAESTAGGVEGNAHEVGMMTSEHVVQRIDKAENGRCVLSFGVDARTADQGVVGTVNQCVGIEQIEGLHGRILY